MNKIVSALILLALITLTGCGQTPPADRPAGTPVVATVPAVTVPALTLAAIMNGSYQPSEPLQGPFQLANGQYAAPDGSVTIQVLEDWIVFGDLNTDGAGDAAALVAENYGGSGVFMFLVVFLNDNGRPVQLTPVLLGDRVQPQGFQTEAGLLTLDLLVQAPNDPLCCPTVPVTWTYLLIDRQVLLLRSTSRTPTGAERTIMIEGPLMGDTVGASVRVTGRVSIAPFENNLVCRIYQGSTLLASLPFMVNAPDMGAPGTFDVEVDLSAVPAGLVRIELLDLSAADGSILASDSVLVFK